MGRNVFNKECGNFCFESYMKSIENGRVNLGDQLPVAVYRMFEYSMKDELIKEFGKEKTVDIMRKAGFTSGTFFANNMLDLTLDFGGFVSQLTQKLEEYKIGVLRIENVNDEKSHITLTVAEDADCSGLPVLGETVCNYDEGFISAIMTAYTHTDYSAVEVDCWATGDRVCRFDVRRLGGE